MTIKNRLERLERAIGADAFNRCECCGHILDAPTHIEFHLTDEPESDDETLFLEDGTRAPEPCEMCGGYGVGLAMLYSGTFIGANGGAVAAESTD